MGNGDEVIGVIDVTETRRPVLDLDALAAPPQDDQPRPRVLVVDDEADIRDWLRVTLDIQGWDVAEAPTAEAALEVAATTPPDLVILDQQLPGASGIACAQ